LRHVGDHRHSAGRRRARREALGRTREPERERASRQGEAGARGDEERVRGEQHAARPDAVAEHARRDRGDQAQDRIRRVEGAGLRLAQAEAGGVGREERDQREVDDLVEHDGRVGEQETPVGRAPWHLLYQLDRTYGREGSAVMARGQGYYHVRWNELEDYPG